MLQKGMALCLSVLLVCVGIKVFAQEKSENRGVSERLIAQIDLSSWIKNTLTVSPDGKRVAYWAQVGNKRFVVVDGKEEKQYDDIVAGTLIFSPDSKRVAYRAMAKVDNKWFAVAVVDGREEKQYDGTGNPIFSPDGKRVAYGARAGDKQFVVVDGKEGRQYDTLLVGGKIVFDSPDGLHYLASKGSEIYLVEEKIK